MLLNVNNFFNIPDIGILMYIPEKNSIFFYKQFKDKEFKFTDINFRGATQIIFSNIQQKKEPKNLIIESQFKKELFIDYYNDERLRKLDDFLALDNTIDYILGINSSKKPTLFRIDWKVYSIQYYEGKLASEELSYIKIHDSRIPCPDINALMDDLSPFREQAWKILEDPLNAFEKQLKKNNIIELQKFRCEGSSDLPNLLPILQQIGLVENAVELDMLLNALRTSIFIDNWLEKYKILEGNIKIFKDALEIEYKAPIDADFEITCLGEKFYQTVGSSNTEIQVKKLFTEIQFKINSNTTITSNIAGANLCGAENCFQLYKDEATNEQYGIRFSNILYAPNKSELSSSNKSELYRNKSELYNKINGMLNNAIVYLMIENFNNNVLPSKLVRKPGLKTKKQKQKTNKKNNKKNNNTQKPNVNEASSNKAKNNQQTPPLKTQRSRYTTQNTDNISFSENSSNVLPSNLVRKPPLRRPASNHKMHRKTSKSVLNTSSKQNNNTQTPNVNEASSNKANNQRTPPLKRKTQRSRYTTQKVVNISPQIAKIQEITQVGLIKVVLSHDKYGYIPYIITKNSDTQINIQTYIEQRINIKDGATWAEDDIKIFIFNLIIKVINFIIIAYAKLNFMHRDLKLNNIVIDTKNNTIYIIDFDWSCLNINYSTGEDHSSIYFLTPKYPPDEQEPYSEYKSNLKMINNKQTFLDTDIQGFLSYFRFVEEEYNSGKLIEDYKVIAEQNPSANIVTYHKFIDKFLTEDMLYLGDSFIKPIPEKPKSLLYEKLVEKKINLRTNTLIFRFFNIMDTLGFKYGFDLLEFINYANYKLIFYYDSFEYHEDKESYNKQMQSESQAGGKTKQNTKTNTLNTYKKRKI